MQHELFMIVNVVMKLCYEKMNDHEQKIGQKNVRTYGKGNGVGTKGLLHFIQ